MKPIKKIIIARLETSENKIFEKEKENNTCSTAICEVNTNSKCKKNRKRSNRKTVRKKNHKNNYDQKLSDNSIPNTTKHIKENKIKTQKCLQANLYSAYNDESKFYKYVPNLQSIIISTIT